MTRTTITAPLLLAATFALATQAFAQAPSEAQREAIKSNCRSDYIAHCSSIPPGGAASLECLQKNMGSLSGACATAVRAVEAPAATAPKAAEEPKAEPKTETKTETKSEPAPVKEAKPAAAESKAASATKKPSQAQISAIKSACRSDYMKVCAGVPTGGAPALQCLEKNKSKVSASCAKAVTAASGGGAAPAGGAPAAAGGGNSGGGAAAAPAAPAVIVLRPMRPREELFVLRSACGGDVRSLCGGVPVGGGRIIQCLASQAAALSPACKDVLSQFAQ
jgi:outer membrane biosynthesis protein TonB